MAILTRSNLLISKPSLRGVKSCLRFTPLPCLLITETRTSIALCADSCTLHYLAFDLPSCLAELREGYADLSANTVYNHPRLIVVSVAVVLVGHATHVAAGGLIGQNPCLGVLNTDA